jgi:hypothetical protein
MGDTCYEIPVDSEGFLWPIIFKTNYRIKLLTEYESVTKKGTYRINTADC